MADADDCTVFVGNLDEKVSDRVIYDILIQAGKVVNLYRPLDKQTRKPRCFAFAQYETPEIANYAVSLFSPGIVVLYDRTLKFETNCRENPFTDTPRSSISCPKPNHQPPQKFPRSDSRSKPRFNICPASIPRYPPRLSKSNEARVGNTINGCLAVRHSRGFKSNFVQRNQGYRRWNFGN